jgi:dienelactone hydrolase
LVILIVLTLSCRQQPAAVAPLSSVVVSAPTESENGPVLEPLATTSPTAVTAAPTKTAVPSATPTNTATPTSSPTAPEAATETASVTPTPDPYAAHSISALAARAYGGGELEIVERMETNERFARYLITYPSDGLTVYGFMNVPHEGSRFPVAIVLHGYINPADYDTLAYTSRYADALADAGYFVLHPNLRGFPPSEEASSSDEASSEGEDAFRTGLAADVLNLIAIVREQSSDPEGPLRRADAEAIHLWGHSMGGGVVLRVAAVLREPYLRAGVLYGAMSGDEVQNYEKILQWSEGNSGQFELAASPEALQAISPIHHLQRINTPLSIHHGEGDETVPAQWSADLCARLQALDHPVECFTYNAAPHTFYGAWEELFNKRVVEFFDRY